MSRLFCFGLGYSAEAVARRLAAKGWEIAGTARDPQHLETLAGQGYAMTPFLGEAADDHVAVALQGATHLLVSIPPGETGDPVLTVYREEIASLPSLQWIGYLSTIGVYGDQGGARVDEATPVSPRNARARHRVGAEEDWLRLGETTGKPVQIFRIAGIYGPGRSPLDKVKAGTARRIVKPGQIFNRIHVEDIAAALEGSIELPRAGAIYNLADDEPAAPDAVVAYAAELLGMAAPPEEPFETADLTPMARSFYGESKRVANDLIKAELGVQLAYPTYREGLASLLDR